jgi:hypothetical protein
MKSAGQNMAIVVFWMQPTFYMYLIVVLNPKQQI